MTASTQSTMPGTAPEALPEPAQATGPVPAAEPGTPPTITTPDAVPDAPADGSTPEASTAGDIEALRERMADLCASAVDPLEVTAGLEAEGINDEAAQKYGHPDVFALAEDLYARTPRRPRPPGATVAPWQAVPWRHLLRGVLFGMPGLCYIVGTPMLHGRADNVLLVFSLLLSWMMSQGTAYLGYVWLGFGNRTAASRVLRYGLAAGLLIVVPATVAAGVAAGAGGRAIALSAGLCGYLLAATVAQVNGAEIRLFLAMLPGVGAVMIYLAGNGWTLPTGRLDGTTEVVPGTAESVGLETMPGIEAVPGTAAASGAVPGTVWIAWAVSLAATIALAIACTSEAGRLWRRRGGVQGGPAMSGPVVTRRDVAAALPFALFGLLTGGLLTFTLLCALVGRPVPPGTTTVAVLSLSLSMGIAEWILYAYRRRVHELLVTHTGMAGFARSARAALAVALARYAASAVVLIAVAAPLARLPTTAMTARTLGGFLALGCAFFLSLVLQACGRVGVVLPVYTLALAAEVAAALTLPHVTPSTVQLLVSGALLVFLTTYAGRVLARVTSHR
ncbi:hypothetical protein [Actinomadura sp. 3N508]|uniref:hypothetical protein n=1 Tax=Actinomadura sp. 3N508 TaxID=3375153 RepID=UPI003799DF17